MTEFLKLNLKLEVFLPFLKAILIAIIGIIVVKAAVKGANTLLHKTKLEPMLHKFIIHALEALIWIVVILAILSALGVDSTSVVTVLAACGAAVALALQGSLSNLAGGILVMVNHPFSSGDTIVIAGQEGTVQSIDIFNTSILTPDNRIVLIPNGTISNSVLENNTSSGIRRVEVKIGVSYNSNVDKAREVLTDLAKAESLIIDNPKPYCVVWEYADSAIILSLRAYCKSEKYWDAKFALQNKAKTALDNAGIEIPFPQLDVHLDK